MEITLMPLQELDEMIPEVEKGGISAKDIDCIKKILNYNFEGDKKQDAFLRDSALYLAGSANTNYKLDSKERQLLLKAVGLIGRLI